MESETVLYEKSDNIVFITFNRPEKRNAINSELMFAFLEALRKAESDPGARVVILRGEGKAFCSGDDLDAPTPATEEDALRFMEVLHDTSRIIMRMPKPVIAALQGYAVGAGCEWAMNCDLRVAAEGTRFRFVETFVGMTITNAGTMILSRLVGLGKAKELALTGRWFDAEEAERWGMVNKVVPLEELDKAAVDLAREIAQNSSLAVGLTKAAINQGALRGVEDTFLQETRDLVITLMGQEAKERSKAHIATTRNK